MIVNIDGLSSLNKRLSLSDCVKSKTQPYAAHTRKTIKQKQEEKSGRLCKYLSSTQNKHKENSDWPQFKVEVRVKSIASDKGHFILIKSKLHNGTVRDMPFPRSRKHKV